MNDFSREIPAKYRDVVKISKERGLIRNREVMASTLAKQENLGDMLRPQRLQEALKPLRDATGVDFFELYQKNYDIDPLPGKIKEEAVNEIEKTGDFQLVKFFGNYPDRRHFYRYIKSRFNLKSEKEYQDYIVVEEKTESGVLMTIFDYPNMDEDPSWDKIYIQGNLKKVNSLRLRCCYAVKTDGRRGEEDQAIDLTSFWYRPDDKNGSQAEKNPVWKIVLVDKDQPITLADQVNNIMQKGKFVIQDQPLTERWVNLAMAASAVSQDESDKRGEVLAGLEADRSTMMMGQIRLLLGELTGEETSNLTPAEKSSLTPEKLESLPEEEQLNHMIGLHMDIRQASALEQSLIEARDWIRNRSANALAIFLVMHGLGFDIVPTSEYKNIIEGVENILKKVEERQ